jgi:hypothetical protein
MTLPDYRPYADLPPMAGIASYDDVMRVGLSIETCVQRLKRHHWAFRRLHDIFIKRLTAEPIYELKMSFSLHAHYCAEHAAAWRRRVAEMREPPLGLDNVPDAALDVFFDEILAAPSTDALLLGLYEHAIPALRRAVHRHLAETNVLVDHPTVRIARFALLELDEMAAFGEKALASAVCAERRAALREWNELLIELLALSGELDGSVDAGEGTIRRLHSAFPPAYDKRPRRDERFTDPYNLGVHAEAFLYDENLPAAPKVLMMYYKRLREIDVPEMMASIIAETADEPWQYYVDMTRQLWDEARHALMGEAGFIRAGVDWRKFVRVNFTWSLALNTQLQPIERHAVLYFIEQGLMPRTGKRFEWETGVASGDAFAAMIQDYDWADEVLHARIGRDWYVRRFPEASRAIEYGDQCWSRVAIDWEKYRAEGLTNHENWWPELYQAWCKVRGISPEPDVLAFSTSYRQVRADLKLLSGSA